MQIAPFISKYLQIVCEIYAWDHKAAHRNLYRDINVIADKIHRIQDNFCVEYCLFLQRQTRRIWICSRYQQPYKENMGQKNTIAWAKHWGSGVFKLPWPWYFNSCHAPFSFLCRCHFYLCNEREKMWFHNCWIYLPCCNSAVQPSPMALPSPTATSSLEKSHGNCKAAINPKDSTLGATEGCWPVSGFPQNRSEYSQNTSSSMEIRLWPMFDQTKCETLGNFLLIPQFSIMGHRHHSDTHAMHWWV